MVTASLTVRSRDRPAGTSSFRIWRVRDYARFWVDKYAKSAKNGSSHGTLDAAILGTGVASSRNRATCSSSTGLFRPKRCQMTQYPLLFGFNDLLAGKGFFAGVSVSGRGLLVDEGDGFWMYGVNPGGVAAGGKTPAEAQSEFRLVYRSVPFDIASEAMDFHGFKEEVDRFFNDTNKPTLA